MRRHLKTLACTVAAFYVGCLVPLGIMGISVLLLPNSSRSVSNVLAGIAVVVGIATIPVAFNLLDRLWTGPEGERADS